MVCLILGGFVYGTGAYQSVANGRSIPWRWIGVCLIALGLLSAAQHLWDLMNPSMGAFYEQTIRTRTNKIAHYALPILMLAALLAVVPIERIIRRELHSEFRHDEFTQR